MVYNRSEHKDLFDLKETTPEVLKYLLKIIYFETFDPQDISDSHMFAIDVYKLAHRLDIKSIQDLIEEELAKMINLDSFVAIAEFAHSFKLSKMLESIKEFTTRNEKQIFDNIQKYLKNDSNESFEKLVQLLNLSQSQIIQILSDISGESQDVKYWNKYRPLIKLELCSIRDINTLRNARLFDSKELDQIIEHKFEELVAKHNLLDIRCHKLAEELTEKAQKSDRMANDYNELNQMLADIMAHYREVKEVFEPFVEGVGGRVNQYVYNKSNCYFGKLPKKFWFKYWDNYWSFGFYFRLIQKNYYIIKMLTNFVLIFF